MSAHDCVAEFDPACPDCIKHDETCGTRCDRCAERMCSLFGPEPSVTCSACHVCVDCADVTTCTECATILAERGQDRAEQSTFDAGRES